MIKANDWIGYEFTDNSIIIMLFILKGCCHYQINSLTMDTSGFQYIIKNPVLIPHKKWKDVTKISIQLKHIKNIYLMNFQGLHKKNLNNKVLETYCLAQNIRRKC
jgi:hypothetical protein